MLEGSHVRVTLGTGGTDRPGNFFIGRVESMDFSGVQIFGRWHRKALKDDGHKEVPIGADDRHAFFPWGSVDYIDILPESEGQENSFAEVYRQGLQALKSKNYSAAAEFFRQALTLKPGDQKSQYYLEESMRLSQS